MGELGFGKGLSVGVGLEELVEDVVYLWGEEKV